MSTEAPTTDHAPEAETPQEGEPKVFDEAYVKKLRDEAAKHRTDAKANAKAADELAAIKRSQQTEAERTAAELAEAQNEAQQARTEALRFRIASKHQVSDEDADLFLTGTDEETLTKQAQRLSEKAAERKRTGNKAPLEGGVSDPPADEVREFARGLFGHTS